MNGGGTELVHAVNESNKPLATSDAPCCRLGPCRASTGRVRRRCSRRRSSACGPATCRSLFVRGANPVFTSPKSAKVRRGDGQSAVQGELLELSGRDHGALRPGAARPSRARDRGAMRSRCWTSSRCSSRAWIRCSTRARQPMCSLDRPSRTRRRRRSSPRRTIMRWLIEHATRAARRRSRPRCRRAWVRGRCRIAPRPRAPPRRRRRRRGGRRAGDFFLVVYPSACVRRRQRRQQAVAAGIAGPGHQDRLAVVGRGQRADGGRLGIDTGDHPAHRDATERSRLPAYVYMGIQAERWRLRSAGATRRTVATRRTWRSNAVRSAPGELRSGVGRLPLGIDQGRVAKTGKFAQARDDRRLGAPARPRHRARGHAWTSSRRRPRKNSARRSPGDASHEFLPGLRCAGRERRAGRHSAIAQVEREGDVRPQALEPAWPSAAGR